MGTSTATDVTTLQTVLTAVGPPVLRALCLPQGADRAVTSVALLDAAEGVSPEPGTALLAMGCRPESFATHAIIRDAAAGGLPAVIAKAYGEDLAPAVEAAQAAGIALLLADEAVPWMHVYRLLASAVADGRSAGQEPVSAIVTGDLFALANAAAAMVGGAISIEDLHQHVLAYSTVPDQPIDDARQAGILGRRVPAEFRLADLYDDVRRSTTVQRVELDGIRPRLAMAIRAGDEPIGSIWAIEGDEGFAPDAERALADAARLAALQVLRLRTTADLERTSRAEALRALLSGNPSPPASGLPPAEDTGMTVVAYALAGAPEDPDGTLLSRVADLVTVYCESLHRQASCLTIDRTIYTLLPVGPSVDRAMMRVMVARVLDRAEHSLHVRLRAGIGRTVDDLAEVVESRVDADRVLQVLAERGDEAGAASIADVRSRAVLLHLAELVADDPRFRLDALDRMAAHDAEKGTDYVATLRTYLDTLGDVPAASERMFLHQNTFRHRMRRMTEIFEVNLEDPDERLVLWLLLRVRP